MLNISRKKVIISIVIFLIFSIFFIFKRIFYKNTNTDLNACRYEKVIQELDIKKIETLNNAKNFIMHNNNIYGILTAMFLAKIYISSNDLNNAFLQLNNVLHYSENEELKNIIKLRMVKIKLQKHENQDAIDILNSIKDINWNHIIENIKGDIFIDNKNKKQAIKSWKKSRTLETSHTSKEILNMKISEFQ
ncbi:MAG: tetratricopeptide repeat protein [Buchnera aphidicola (Pentalonia nigronervosa)]|jgi:predicted negative regulator of RcsB-dependent stress response|uniref:Tetratricopeptide repeat protein n=1 Tax=Buchnera aphidicola (Pentalonia nigronervosa) TaxID=1309793 RepID=A0A7H1AZ54_9GAMM|nr:MAG: tetratricopeptide repeat protein [Buchnera aphidicola (Pentalonia nigronervosa)]